MKIASEGYIVAIKKIQEKGLILNIFSKEHGLVSGYSRFNSKQPFTHGSFGNFTFKSRLAEHLGNLTFEPSKEHLSKVIYCPTKSRLFLLALDSIATFLEAGEPHHSIFDALENFFAKVTHKAEAIDDIANYLRFEYQLLQGIGYGLDFSQCAVSGSSDELSFISPKTGAVVSHSVGAPYQDKLLKIPALYFQDDYELQDLIDASLINELILTKFVILPSFRNFDSAGVIKDMLCSIGYKLDIVK